MKTLEQTLEELKQLEELVNTSNGKFDDTQLEKIAEQLSDAFSLAQEELNKVEENTKQISENEE
jgi:hypothetical protein